MMILVSPLNFNHLGTKFNDLKRSSDFNTEKFAAVEKQYNEKSEILKSKMSEIQTELAAESEITKSWVEKFEEMRSLKDKQEIEIMNNKNTINILEKQNEELLKIKKENELKLKGFRSQTSLLHDNESQNNIEIENLKRRIKSNEAVIFNLEKEMAFTKKDKLHQINLVENKCNKDIDELTMIVEDSLSNVARTNKLLDLSKSENLNLNQKLAELQESYNKQDESLTFYKKKTDDLQRELDHKIEEYRINMSNFK